MNIVRWDPFRELEEVSSRLSRVLGQAPSRRASDEEFFADWVPAVDVQETEKDYLVKADLPEIKKDDVKVNIADGMLTLEGERTQEKEEAGKKFHKIEREYGKFVRRFSLPTDIDAQGVSAEFKDGVLNVRLPKSASSKPKSITVKVA